MPTFEFTAPDGKSYQVDGPEGATQEQAFSMLQKQLAAGTPPATQEPSLTAKAGRALNDIPRQVGLTARYGLEGVANAAQLFTEPLRYVTDKFVPDRSAGVSGLVTGQAAPPKSTPLGVQATKLADALGLPSPQTPGERVVAEGTKLMAGAGGMIPAFSAVGRATQATAPLIGNTLSQLATNPAQQLTSAAGAGMAGGASKEAGGGPMQQFLASTIGGIAGGLVPAAIPAAGLKTLTTKPPTPQELDVRITTTLRDAGVDFSQLPEAARTALRADMARALRTGEQVDPQALARLAAFRAVPGATPTRGMISQNPVDITQEQNLAKIAANASDTQLQGLPLLQNRNNTALIGSLNTLGAERGVTPLQAGNTVTSAIIGRQTDLRGAERAAWKAAEASPAYTAPISNEPVVAGFARAADKALVGFLPEQITSYMGAFQRGDQPFTPQHYANLRSLLSAQQAKGGNEARAATAVIEGLDSMPIRPITNPRGLDFGNLPSTPAQAAALRGMDAQAPSAVGAIDAARRATRAAYAYEDSSPLVRSVVGGARTAEPERIAQSYVINGTLGEARSVAQEVGPAGMPVVRDALINHIKQKALSGAADETGKVSQAALNRAINSIGEEKLRLFFTPAEVDQLRNTGRVAALMTNQPIGSAVNNSNSGALLVGKGLDALTGLANKVPGGKSLISTPVNDIRITLGERRAQNVIPGLLQAAPGSQIPLAAPLLLPAFAATGGLLSAP